MTQQNLPVMRSDDRDPIGTQASQAHVTRVACNLFSHKSVSRYRRPLKPGGTPHTKGVGMLVGKFELNL